MHPQHAPRHAPTTCTHRKLGLFYPRVLRRIEIDLSNHGLPGLQEPVTFEFLDPLFAWSICAHKLTRRGHKLHFKYRARTHPATGESLYGASVANGEFMRRACQRGPPALIGISYDAGQATRRRSYAPILVSVANTDYNGRDACECVGYMPELQLGSSAGTDTVKKAMHELRQACIRAIVDVLERAGRFGFMCTLCQQDGGIDEVQRVLFPVLCRMEFDTKERFKFFCCARERACAIGSGPRQGHSALRFCTSHSTRADLIVKMETALRPGCADAEAAADSLSRRGIHPTHRCTAITHLQHCVYRWPGRIYFGLFAFDVMHHLYINCTEYLLDAVLATMKPAKHKILDQRAKKYVSFRRANGVRSPQVRKLSSTAYLTAEKKVTALFMWPHALGSQAIILPAQVRRDALEAISSLQIICHSTRRLTPFTMTEHRYIFNNIGRRFFQALSRLQHFKRTQQIESALKYNVDKLPSKRRRVPYWKDVVKHSDESSSTASSTDEDLPPYFLRSGKIVPHSFVHFPEQVYIGGSHQFHNTSAQESHHPISLGLCGVRSRTYGDMNKNTLNMLHFNNDLRMLREICVQARVDDATHGIRIVIHDIVYAPKTCTHDVHPRYNTIYPRHVPTTCTHDIMQCTHDMYSRHDPR